MYKINNSKSQISKVYGIFFTKQKGSLLSIIKDHYRDQFNSNSSESTCKMYINSPQQVLVYMEGTITP